MPFKQSLKDFAMIVTEKIIKIKSWLQTANQSCFIFTSIRFIMGEWSGQISTDNCIGSQYFFQSVKNQTLEDFIKKFLKNSRERQRVHINIKAYMQLTKAMHTRKIN